MPDPQSLRQQAPHRTQSDVDSILARLHCHVAEILIKSGFLPDVDVEVCSVISKPVANHDCIAGVRPPCLGCMVRGGVDRVVVWCDLVGVGSGLIVQIELLGLYRDNQGAWMVEVAELRGWGTWGRGSRGALGCWA
ncbi:unnamed protein product [Prunus armeniaca]|uniref:Uncharacterized protein n=1 Tax=Prunus armeniaca TaxID=36596 RepID=A0A6J5XGK4_PRUAR|nr:unnamed protein product [Prunus armeniaca]CAB4311082.1 unnamed protein product [Prunus armeniaca]